MSDAAVDKDDPALQKRLDDMIVALQDWQPVLAAAGYPDSARLARIFTLDLQLKRHSISEVELAEFSRVLEQASEPSTAGRRLTKIYPLRATPTVPPGRAPAQNMEIMRASRSRKKER